MQRNQTYSFAIHAETTFGIGKNATVSVTIGRYFGQVRNLRAYVDHSYSMTILWDAPSKIDADDIKVGDDRGNSNYSKHDCSCKYDI